MPIDPFYEKMRPEWKVRQWVIRVWPSIYNVINHLFFSLVDSLREMVRSVYNSLKP